MNHLGKTILIGSQGTPIKAIVADALNVPTHRVKCDKGSWYVAQIDETGKISVNLGRSSGIAIQNQ